MSCLQDISPTEGDECDGRVPLFDRRQGPAQRELRLALRKRKVLLFIDRKEGQNVPHTCHMGGIGHADTLR